MLASRAAPPSRYSQCSFLLPPSTCCKRQREKRGWVIQCCALNARSAASSPGSDTPCRIQSAPLLGRGSFLAGM